MDALRRDSPRQQPGRQVLDHQRWAADEDVTVPDVRVDRLQVGHCQAPEGLLADRDDPEGRVVVGYLEELVEEVRLLGAGGAVVEVRAYRPVQAAGPAQEWC